MHFFTRFILQCIDVTTVQLAVHELYSDLWPDSQQIICPNCDHIANQHFGKISQQTVFAICKFKVVTNLLIIITVC